MGKIISCKYDDGGDNKNQTIQQDQTIIIDSSTGYSAARFYVDESCFDDKKMPENGINWSVVYQEAFANAQNGKSKDGKIDSRLWAIKDGSKSFDFYGMDTNYKAGFEINVVGIGYSALYYNGYYQKVFVFTEDPIQAFTFFIIPVSTPTISFAHFENSEKIFQYGEYVNLKVKFHNFYSEDESEETCTKLFIIEDNAKNSTLGIEENLQEIKLDTLAEASVWESNEHIFPDRKSSKGKSANMVIENTVLIDVEKWRKGQIEMKEFSVLAIVYTKFYKFGIPYKNKITSVRNFLNDPTNDLVTYDKTILGVSDIDEIKSSISSRIKVSAELISEYLQRSEDNKNNMIQYIGDVLYTSKENNPCAYSVITANDGTQDIEVFHEYKLSTQSGDQTSRFTDIISGDESKKTVSVKVQFINPVTKKREKVRTEENNFKCEKILNDGKSHIGLKDVFKMGWIVGQWVPSKDPALFVERYKKMLGTLNSPLFYHPTNSDSSPIIKWDKSDQAAKGIEVTKEDKKIYEAVTVAGIQGLLKEDYAIDDNKNTISLQLKYTYNKTVAENSQKYTGSIINNLWLFNYFILNEKMAQTFFVPVTTCRYPNQIVKFRVFPDIEWEVAFLVTIGNGYTGKIKYERSNLSGIHTNKDFGFKYVKSELKIEGEETDNLGWTLKAKAVENGTEHEVGIESIKKITNAAVFAFNVTRKSLDIFNPAHSDGSPSLAQSRKVIDVDFAIDPPNIGFALSWKFGKASNNDIVPIYTGGLKADPLIGLTITVDLVPLIKFLGPIGNVLNWIIKFIEWLSKSDIYITFELNIPVKAELSLSYNRIDEFTNKGKQKMIVEPSVTIRAGCKSNEVIMIPTTTNNGITETAEKWKIEGNVSTSVNFEKEWGYDKAVNKYYEQSSYNFKGAKMTIIISELISNRRIDFKPTHQEVFTIIEEVNDLNHNSGKIYVDEK